MRNPMTGVFRESRMRESSHVRFDEGMVSPRVILLLSVLLYWPVRFFFPPSGEPKTNMAADERRSNQQGGAHVTVKRRGRGNAPGLCENGGMRHLMILAALLAVLAPPRSAAQYVRPRPAGATATTGPYTGPAVTFNGTLKGLTKKQLVVDLDQSDPDADHQSLTFRFSKKTKFLKGDQPIKPADIAMGTHISLDAVRDGDQKLSAVNVFVAPPPAADKTVH